MGSEFNLIVAGVGGQGILFTSRVITRAALMEGKNFIQSEVHGLSQRYGSIRTEIRIGDDVFSPLIVPGTLDLLMALEPIEGARCAEYVSRRTSVIINTHLIPPIGAAVAGIRVPSLEEVVDALRLMGPKSLITVPATELAKEVGDPMVTNVVMLGAAEGIGVMPFEEGTLLRALEEVSPERYRELNVRAFEAGRRYTRESTE